MVVTNNDNNNEKPKNKVDTLHQSTVVLVYNRERTVVEGGGIGAWGMNRIQIGMLKV